MWSWFAGGSTGSCGGTLTAAEGSIKSPNYPADYPNNQDCTWTITVEDGKVRNTFHWRRVSVMVFQSTDNWNVCDTHANRVENKQSGHSFVRVKHQWPVDSPHKWPLMQKAVSSWITLDLYLLHHINLVQTKTSCRWCSRYIRQECLDILTKKWNSEQ